MHIEIGQATEFLGRLLQSKVDLEVINKFKEELSGLLKEHYTGHWDPQQPYRGNAYRAISNFNGQVDPIIAQACLKADCSIELIHHHLPREFVLWIDPYAVSYRVGDHGNINTLYEDRSRGKITMNNGMISPSQSPKILNYIQQAQSVPVRISPPSSPESKKIIAAKLNHHHSPSPLAQKDEVVA